MGRLKVSSVTLTTQTTSSRTTLPTRSISNYHDSYHRNRHVAFLLACMSTSGHIHSELLRLIFYISNKQAEDYFEDLGYQQLSQVDETEPQWTLCSLANVCGHCHAWVWISTDCILRKKSFYPLCFFLSTHSKPISPDHISRSQCNSLCHVTPGVLSLTLRLLPTKPGYHRDGMCSGCVVVAPTTVSHQ